MHIGILQTGHAADPVRAENGDYDEMFQRLLGGHGLTFTTWNVVDGVFPDGPESAEGWLITGSRHGAYDDLPWIPRLEALIRDIRDVHRPLVGICFGHQIVAQALGGKVEKFAGGWSVGPQTYTIEGRDYRVPAWHQDQVVEVPREAQVVGHSDFCANAALLYDGILTIQPHPEFDAATVRGLIEHRGRGTVPDGLLDAATDGLDRPMDRAAMAERLATFLKEHA
ncbi:type 1 glutamine amidotransferase [Roseitranquillus sediminis]|uniref:type 1 glutamine amidotransferase n=1 Tax=Roseitranquillus sediminis TaxID=2809051 RepID=UPI001D0CB8A9|nr:type 1 glutamine amidotransferase [Roseitranquillus sediminis]MBM9594288.1 type 1 glutamine amidotransferase [Roseitranquillus sediminis]